MDIDAEREGRPQWGLPGVAEWTTTEVQEMVGMQPCMKEAQRRSVGVGGSPIHGLMACPSAQGRRGSYSM